MQDRERVIAGQGLPNRPRVFTPICSKVAAGARTCLRGVAEANGEVFEPSYRCIQDTATKWLKTFLRDGSLLDKSPQRAGERISANLLRRLRDVILAGYPDGQGITRIHRSVPEIANKGPPGFA